ncbi:Peptidyl-prolyl cis-trans isomerase (rotamase)-cyclophilin family [Allosphingosinicella indica]|uniref:peptidylprolyl isomerase n=1 Tax=Allosphingosinicella indica TaxID=941907 RepID=A0A1X7GG17_9SPHN|nr:Peptidyl-prolyl cis-trans isomerase (rotamase)-cyclophilin family [Allosphingosinicella indica]
MRLNNLFAAIAALFFATGLAAQTAQPAFSVAPPPLDPENTWVLDLTTGGRVTIQLRPDAAPNAVERIKTLTRQGFYNGTIFHRVIEGFMAQGGDPGGDGTGGSSLPDVNAEFNVLPHVRGAVAAARGGDVNSANSQYYIMFGPRLQLDRKYTVFGRVVSGMEFVDKIERGEPPANPSRVVRASIGADNVPPPSPQEVAAVASAPLPRGRAAAPPAAVQSLGSGTAQPGQAAPAEAAQPTTPSAETPATTQPPATPSAPPPSESTANPNESTTPQDASEAAPQPGATPTPEPTPTPQPDTPTPQ